MTGRCSNVHVVDFIRKLADAVLAVHRHLKRMGAGERDGGHGLLLPAFLMVRADRSLRIAGLGLAKALYMTRPALVRQFAEVLGQSSFLAPESRSGAVPPATAMADLYSIGALTFFAACNADPEESRHALTELNLNVAPQMADIVRHCLRHDPKARFARLEEIVRALDMSVDPEGPRELPVNAPFARNEALLSADPKFSGEMAIADADPDADRGGPPLNRFIPLKFARADAPRQLAAIASLEPAMQLIQAGPSRQGSHGGAEDERPERAAYLDAFYMAQTAVTAEAFALFLTEKVRDDASEWLIEEPMALVVRRLLRKGYHALKGAERLPANCVSFAGAKAFCAWLAEKTGKPYRLPSEAEWERAARGPWRLSKRLYPWGDDNPTPLTSRFGRQWVNNPAETMAPVDGLAPSASPEGVLQMAGNVWEWCEDFYDRRAYALEGDPVIRPRGPEKGFKRVARGGAWMSGPKELRCASRRGETPRPDSAGGALGFRLAMSVPAVWSEEAPSGRALEEGKQG
jgi:formylglycine-generating enzyme required for sulfatase activity